MKLAALLAEARASLAASGIDDPNLDARLIVEHFSGTDRADAIGRPDMPVSPEARQAIEAAIARRAAGEPVHRILGFREFYGLRLNLSSERDGGVAKQAGGHDPSLRARLSHSHRPSPQGLRIGSVPDGRERRRSGSFLG